LTPSNPSLPVNIDNRPFTIQIVEVPGEQPPMAAEKLKDQSPQNLHTQEEKNPVFGELDPKYTLLFIFTVLFTATSVGICYFCIKEVSFSFSRREKKRDKLNSWPYRTRFVSTSWSILFC